MKTREELNKTVLNELALKVNSEIPTPLYYQLFVELKAMIDSGQLKSGDELPTEQEICDTLGVSRPTVRQCMQQLSNSGYIVRKRGKGTFVEKNKMELNYIARHESFHDIITSHGYTPSTDIVDFQIIDPVPSINSILEIPENEKLYSLLRICKADGVPMLYCHTYLQASRFPGLQKFDISKVSLYSILEAEYGVKVEVLKREIGADNASQNDAQVLQIKKGRAIFIVNNLAYDKDSVPVEYSISHYRSETIKFTNYMKC